MNKTKLSLNLSINNSVEFEAYRFGRYDLIGNQCDAYYDPSSPEPLLLLIYLNKNGDYDPDSWRISRVKDANSIGHLVCNASNKGEPAQPGFFDSRMPIIDDLKELLKYNGEVRKSWNHFKRQGATKVTKLSSSHSELREKNGASTHNSNGRGKSTETITTGKVGITRTTKSESDLLNDFLSEIEESENPSPKYTAGEQVDDLVYMYSSDDLDRLLKEAKSFELPALDSIAESLNEGNPLKELKIATGHEARSVLNLINEFPNFKEVGIVIAGCLKLSALTKTPLDIPNLLLDGEPGTGKTEFLRRVAKCIDIDFIEIQMGIIGGRFELGGANRTYRQSDLGLITKRLINSNYANPIVVFDEACSPEPDVYPTLLQAVEDDLYRDNFLDMNWFVKYVNFMFISNNKSSIPANLRSRLVEYDIKQPTNNEKVKIVLAIFNTLCKEPRFKLFSGQLNEDITNILVHLPLREVRTTLESGFYRSALMCRDAKPILSSSDFVTKKQDFKIGFIS